MAARMSGAAARRRAYPSDDFTIEWLRPRSKEWNAAWEEMARISGDFDKVGEDPVMHEVWQYMGTVERFGGWVHEFRHRNHASTNTRWLLRVPASPGWLPAHELVKKRRALH